MESAHLGQSGPGRLAVLQGRDSLSHHCAAENLEPKMVRTEPGAYSFTELGMHTPLKQSINIMAASRPIFVHD